MTVRKIVFLLQSLLLSFTNILFFSFFFCGVIWWKILEASVTVLPYMLFLKLLLCIKRLEIKGLSLLTLFSRHTHPPKMKRDKHRLQFSATSEVNNREDIFRFLFGSLKSWNSDVGVYAFPWDLFCPTSTELIDYFPPHKII